MEVTLLTRSINNMEKGQTSNQDFNLIQDVLTHTQDNQDQGTLLIQDHLIKLTTEYWLTEETSSIKTIPSNDRTM